MKDDLPFFKRVHQVAKLVPHGRFTTYGAIAEYLGSKGSARMVGWSHEWFSPGRRKYSGHRVVNRIGMLTGKHHFGEASLMQKLMEAEGIAVENDQITEFDKYFWDPSKELL